jgi:hypothetical protein
MNEDFLIDASEQPLEFALLCLDILHDLELEIDENALLEIANPKESFRLQSQLGQDLLLTLQYDADLSHFTAIVATLRPIQNLQCLKQALGMNLLMPAERRFAMDLSSSSLLFTESWLSKGLQLNDLAIGLRVLVHVMQMLMSAKDEGQELQIADTSNFIKV